ncbi:unnamed protein product [Cochlearia groenlandica]
MNMCVLLALSKTSDVVVAEGCWQSREPQVVVYRLPLGPNVVEVFLDKRAAENSMVNQKCNLMDLSGRRLWLQKDARLRLIQTSLFISNNWVRMALKCGLILSGRSLHEFGNPMKK